jgi:hypothetical protein
LKPIPQAGVYGVMTEEHKACLDLAIGPFARKYGYLFRCKLCGEDHEVPENVPPYSTVTHMFFNVHIAAVELGCSTKPGTERYSFTDFAPYRIASN